MSKQDKATLIGTIGLLLIIFIILTISDMGKRDLYNNGIHEGCGDHWHVVAHSHQHYTYECDNCYEAFNTTTLLR